MTPIDRAIEFAGSQRKLAAMLNIDETNVSAWVHARKPVPHKHRMTIERLTRGSAHAVSAFDFE